ncbi:MAG: iron-sulfur cluster assembly accessory protein, partial [Cyanobacteria bacterium J06555_13]
MAQAISSTEALDKALNNPVNEAPQPNLPEPTSAAVAGSERGILMSETALNHVKTLCEKQEGDLCLRVGVRQGGCSGMSYMMDFEQAENIGEHDEVYDYDGFQVVCDRKSLLYLYGLMLDYSD